MSLTNNKFFTSFHGQKNEIYHMYDARSSEIIVLLGDYLGIPGFGVKKSPLIRIMSVAKIAYNFSYLYRLTLIFPVNYLKWAHKIFVIFTLIIIYFYQKSEWR